MKKILKIAALFIGILTIIAVVTILIVSEPLPEGKKGQDADALGHKMLTTLNYDSYKNTRYLEWSFQGGKNHYVWDKEMGKVKVAWGDYIVNLNLVSLTKSVVTKNNNEIIGEEKPTIVNKALAYFNNDSFWLVAPYKIFDQGTERSIVTMEDGSQGLMVTYTAGGDTPGDSYLWVLNENGFPNSFKMWVKVLPIGGLQADWDDWLVSESGAFFPKSHKIGPITLSMGDVRAYN